MKTLIIKINLLLFLGYFSLSTLAQVTFVIQSLPSDTPSDEQIFIAGNFNSWNPGDPSYVLEKNDNSNWQIILPEMENGTLLQFKFTRGNWASVEKGANGEEIPDREFTYGNVETVEFAILSWADHGSGSGNSTAAENVSIMDESFYIPQLDRNRRIWIYLPTNYENTSINYPVIYMHDGQNVFDESTAYSGEWEVDETLNKLALQGYQVPIVIGIDNGGADRIDELTPWVNEEYGGGDGSLYIDFIVETLKPYVDSHYRTKEGRDHTGIFGSSLGGLISHYAAMKYQNIFSKAGVFSPSYWFSDSVWIFTEEMAKQQEMRFYQMAGNNESTSMVLNLNTMNSSLSDLGFTNNELSMKIIPNGEHNEALWKSQFEDAYLWLFSDFASGISTLYTKKEFLISPNPAHNTIHIDSDEFNKIDSLEIFNLNGERVYELKTKTSRNIDISKLKSGVFILNIYSDDVAHHAKFIKL